tara:strand:- start:278 stop:505 length:228 start_codon:yes stop_codon:yes gene_type:complete
MLLIMQKKTNQQKETMNTVEKLELHKNDLVNQIDVLFYDIENIEEQASLFRTILRQHKILTLEAIKDMIKEETKK